MADHPTGTSKNHGSAARTSSDNETPQLFTREEAADLLRCSVRHLDALRSQGKLRNLRLGSRVLIPMSEIRRLIENSMGGVQ
ncbi:MAG: helix-turn-helix domain-containing protein [Phycisphaerales bacterium JB065]